MNNNFIDSIQQSKRSRYLLFIGVMWCYTIVVQYFRAVILRVPLISEYSHQIINITVILLMIFALSDITEGLKVSDVFFVLAIILIYFISYFLFPQNAEYFDSEQNRFLFMVLPFYFIGATMCLKKEEMTEVYDLLYKLSIVTVILFTLYILFINDAGDEYEGGVMSTAYKFLPHICMVFSGVIKKPKVFNIAIFVLGVIMLFSLGTRGTIVCLGVYVLLMMLFVTAVKKPLVTIILFIISYMVLFVFGLYDKILKFLYDFAEFFGLSTRFFDMLYNGRITYDSSRSIIREKVMNELQESSFFGLGLYGDRIASGGSYSHHFFIEVLAHFGYVLGAVIIFSILFVMFKAFIIAIRSKRADIISLFFVGVCVGFVKLFLSGSYVQEPFFFMLIGLSMNLIANKSYIKNTEETDSDEDTAYQRTR